ncbi:MAG: formylglycine-generating enzyme family protein, partial [Myxococcales bacterium]
MATLRTLARELRPESLAALAAALACALAPSWSACVEPRCFDASDCESPQVCGADGVCVFECSSDPDCPEGFACEGHRCKPRPSYPVVCPEDMVPVAEAFCVDIYEASRPDATAQSAGSDESVARSIKGVMPWMVASNAVAEVACAAAGKRLCSAAEWELACRGPEGTVYGYGEHYEPETCNGIDAFGRSAFRLEPTGAFPNCTNGWGLFDMNGNLWEHIAGGSDMLVRGGAFNCGDSATLHRCDYVPGSWAPS